MSPPCAACSTPIPTSHSSAPTAINAGKRTAKFRLYPTANTRPGTFPPAPSSSNQNHQRRASNALKTHSLAGLKSSLSKKESHGSVCPARHYLASYPPLRRTRKCHLQSFRHVPPLESTRVRSNWPLRFLLDRQLLQHYRR